MAASDCHLFLKADLDAPLLFELFGGEVALFTAKSPERESPNQDGAMLLRVNESRGLLAVSDGAGGHEGGERAAEAALLALREEMWAEDDRSFRERLLSGVERGDREIESLKIGAMCTLAAVEIGPDEVRSYHVGDSGVLVVGQRGRRKHESIPHSPVGYAVQAGMIGEREALHHEDRHLVSNLLGAGGAHISMSARIALAARDTVLVASDGLLDNLSVDEIVARIRKGPLARCAADLASLAQARMTRTAETVPSKPDDITFVLYRRKAPPRQRANPEVADAPSTPGAA